VFFFRRDAFKISNMAMGESFPKTMHMLTLIINEQQTIRFIQWFLTNIIKEKTGDLKFRSEWTVFRFTQGPVSSGFTVYIIFLSQLKLRILADFERLPIMKFNEYWCNNDLFCNVKDNILNVTFYWKRKL
jgi:hypothetical protein